MANFDTLSDNSTIKYGFDGVKMIVEWANVRLRDNKEGKDLPKLNNFQ